MPLQSTFDVNLTALYSAAAPALGTGTLPLTLTKSIRLLNGTGANQADKIYTLTNTIAASGTASLDLAGAVSDVFGTIVTLVKVKAILVRAAAANTNSVQLSQPASNGVPGLFSTSGTSINILPGGVFLWVAPGASTITVTPSTGDLLQFANSGAGTSVTYDVAVVGTSA